jgi:hypothetical protein
MEEQRDVVEIWKYMDRIFLIYKYNDNGHKGGKMFEFSSIEEAKEMGADLFK